jgi:hypothetical protein
LAGKKPLKEMAAELERRIRARISKFEPNSPELKAALYRIGFLIEAEAKLNIRRQGAIDTGRLINSVQTTVYQQGSRAGVRVGPRGVPYAAMNEFGGPFTDRQRRAMFASLRERGKLGRAYAPKGVIVGGRYRERPYMRPAVLKHKRRIIEIIRDLFK